MRAALRPRGDRAAPAAGDHLSRRRRLLPRGAEGDGAARAGPALLRFAGLFLALDIPARPGLRGLFVSLERITREAGGRIYLAKDSLLSAEGFWEMYPEAQRFQEIRQSVDPAGRLSSDMAKRLGLVA